MLSPKEACEVSHVPTYTMAVPLANAAPMQMQGGALQLEDVWLGPPSLSRPVRSSCDSPQPRGAPHGAPSAPRLRHAPSCAPRRPPWWTPLQLLINPRRGGVVPVRVRPTLALARLLRKFFQNLRYGRERPKVARKLRSLAGGWAPLYGRAAAEEIFSEVI